MHRVSVRLVPIKLVCEDAGGQVVSQQWRMWLTKLSWHRRWCSCPHSIERRCSSPQTDATRTCTPLWGDWKHGSDKSGCEFGGGLKRLRRAKELHSYIYHWNAWTKNNEQCDIIQVLRSCKVRRGPLLREKRTLISGWINNYCLCRGFNNFQ